MRLSEGQVLGQEAISGGYRHMRVRAPEIAAAARPGQFVHVRVPGLDTASLRRPFSIYRADGDEFAILYKTVGRGTERLAELAAGAHLSLIGPLGNGFPTDIGDRTPILVGGGYGVAPLAFLAARLPRRGVALLGGRSAGDVLCEQDFAALGWSVEVSTQDGTRGSRGLVTMLLDRHLAGSAKGSALELFACGPDGMLRAVGARAIAAGCPAWLSLDHHMVCGIGACLACVQKLRSPDGSTRQARVCSDGPVFEAREIVWEEPPR
ncbi:MAG: dihydroorotate dehydrogenase electron transfer subunit [Kiritimatiellae bacterium]|nr:dihydroorotate dehydrogenase electron transfer subunit [Kiritimatiellia bacterium]